MLKSGQIFVPWFRSSKIGEEFCDDEVLKMCFLRALLFCCRGFSLRNSPRTFLGGDNPFRIWTEKKKGFFLLGILSGAAMAVHGPLQRPPL